jgi:epidermal growth factor receptor substrate 15
MVTSTGAPAKSFRNRKETADAANGVFGNQKPAANSFRKESAGEAAKNVFNSQISSATPTPSPTIKLEPVSTSESSTSTVSTSSVSTSAHTPTQPTPKPTPESVSAGSFRKGSTGKAAQDIFNISPVTTTSSSSTVEVSTTSTQVSLKPTPSPSVSIESSHESRSLSSPVVASIVTPHIPAPSVSSSSTTQVSSSTSHTTVLPTPSPSSHVSSSSSTSSHSSIQTLSSIMNTKSATTVLPTPSPSSTVTVSTRSTATSASPTIAATPSSSAQVSTSSSRSTSTSAHISAEPTPKPIPASSSVGSFRKGSTGKAAQEIFNNNRDTTTSSTSSSKVELSTASTYGPLNSVSSTTSPITIPTRSTVTPTPTAVPTVTIQPSIASSINNEPSSSIATPTPIPTPKWEEIQFKESRLWDGYGGRRIYVPSRPFIIQKPINQSIACGLSDAPNLWDQAVAFLKSLGKSQKPETCKQQPSCDTNWWKEGESLICDPKEAPEQSQTSKGLFDFRAFINKAFGKTSQQKELSQAHEQIKHPVEIGQCLGNATHEEFKGTCSIHSPEITESWGPLYPQQRHRRVPFRDHQNAVSEWAKLADTCEPSEEPHWMTKLLRSAKQVVAKDSSDATPMPELKDEHIIASTVVEDSKAIAQTEMQPEISTKDAPARSFRSSIEIKEAAHQMYSNSSLGFSPMRPRDAIPVEVRQPPKEPMFSEASLELHKKVAQRAKQGPSADVNSKIREKLAARRSSSRRSEIATCEVPQRLKAGECLSSNRTLTASLNRQSLDEVIERGEIVIPEMCDPTEEPTPIYSNHSIGESPAIFSEVESHVPVETSQQDFPARSFRSPIEIKEAAHQIYSNSSLGFSPMIPREDAPVENPVSVKQEVTVAQDVIPEMCDPTEEPASIYSNHSIGESPAIFSEVESHVPMETSQQGSPARSFRSSIEIKEAAHQMYSNSSLGFSPMRPRDAIPVEVRQTPKEPMFSETSLELHRKAAQRAKQGPSASINSKIREKLANLRSSSKRQEASTCEVPQRLKAGECLSSNRTLTTSLNRQSLDEVIERGEIVIPEMCDPTEEPTPIYSNHSIGESPAIFSEVESHVPVETSQQGSPARSFRSSIEIKEAAHRVYPNSSLGFSPMRPRDATPVKSHVSIEQEISPAQASITSSMMQVEPSLTEESSMRVENAISSPSVTSVNSQVERINAVQPFYNLDFEATSSIQASLSITRPIEGVETSMASGIKPQNSQMIGASASASSASVVSQPSTASMQSAISQAVSASQSASAKSFRSQAQVSTAAKQIFTPTVQQASTVIPAVSTPIAAQNSQTIGTTVSASVSSVVSQPSTASVQSAISQAVSASQSAPAKSFRSQAQRSTAAASIFNPVVSQASKVIPAVSTPIAAQNSQTIGTSVSTSVSSVVSQPSTASVQSAISQAVSASQSASAKSFRSQAQVSTAAKQIFTPTVQQASTVVPAVSTPIAAQNSQTIGTTVSASVSSVVSQPSTASVQSAISQAVSASQSASAKSFRSQAQVSTAAASIFNPIDNEGATSGVISSANKASSFRSPQDISSAASNIINGTIPQEEHSSSLDFHTLANPQPSIAVQASQATTSSATSSSAGQQESAWTTITSGLSQLGEGVQKVREYLPEANAKNITIAALVGLALGGAYRLWNNHQTAKKMKIIQEWMAPTSKKVRRLRTQRKSQRVAKEALSEAELLEMKKEEFLRKLTNTLKENPHLREQLIDMLL